MQPGLRTDVRDTEVKESSILLMGEDVEGSSIGSSGGGDTS